MRILILALFAACAWAQMTEVGLWPGPPNTPFQTIFNYSGANLTSACYARSIDNTSRRAGLTVSISAATNANPVVFTSTHGFNVNSRPQVTIKGATAGWATANGTFTATIINSTTFSIPLDSTAFGALSGTLVFSTNAPRTTVAEWGVYQAVYDGSNNLIWKGWLAGSSTLSAKCSDAGSTTLQVQ